jgi:hypothetical protein
MYGRGEVRRDFDVAGDAEGGPQSLALELIAPQPMGGGQSAFKVRLSTQKAIIFRNKIEQRVRELSANPLA